MEDNLKSCKKAGIRVPVKEYGGNGLKKTKTKTHTQKEYDEECSKIEEMIPQMKTPLGTKQKINPYLDTL